MAMIINAGHENKPKFTPFNIYPWDVNDCAMDGNISNTVYNTNGQKFINKCVARPGCVLVCVFECPMICESQTLFESVCIGFECVGSKYIECEHVVLARIGFIYICIA